MRSKAAPALTLLFLVNVLNFYDRLALGAVIEPIRREFHLSDTQLGALVTWFTVVFALTGIPLGRLADRGSRRKILAAGVTLWASLTGLAGIAASYTMLLATRLGVGIGEAVCSPAAVSWIGDIVPAERRGRAMAWFMMAVPVGGLLSFSITGPAAQAWGWRAALAIAAAPMVVLAPALLWLKEPERRRTPAGGRDRFRAPRGFWWIAASGAIINFALYSFSTFVPAFLTRYHGLSVARAGVWMGIGSGTAGVAGAAAAGLIGDRVRNRLGVVAAISLVASGPLFAAISMPAGAAIQTVVLAMTGYGLLQMYYGLVYAVLQDLFPPTMRATGVAVYLVATYLGGASWGPVATGKISDMLARRAAGGGLLSEAARAEGLHQAMYLIPILAVILGAVLWMGQRTQTMSAETPKIA